MLPAIEIGGINALPYGIEADLSGLFYLPEAFMLWMINKEIYLVDDIGIYAPG